MERYLEILAAALGQIARQLDSYIDQRNLLGFVGHSHWQTGPNTATSFLSYSLHHSSQHADKEAIEAAVMMQDVGGIIKMQWEIRWVDGDTIKRLGQTSVDKSRSDKEVLSLCEPMLKGFYVELQDLIRDCSIQKPKKVKRKETPAESELDDDGETQDPPEEFTSFRFNN